MTDRLAERLLRQRGVPSPLPETVGRSRRCANSAIQKPRAAPKAATPPAAGRSPSELQGPYTIPRDAAIRDLTYSRMARMFG
jgi:hypothetical protein